MKNELEAAKRWLKKNLIIFIIIIGITPAIRAFIQGRWLAGLAFLAWIIVVSTAVFFAIKNYDPTK